MENPCHYCVKPERHPGCHDHCVKLKEFYESDEYKKLQKYRDNYLRPQLSSSSAKINRTARRYKSKGYSLKNFRLT